MYSINISSITFTASFAGLRSSPNPYIRFRTRTKELFICVILCENIRTFFREQAFQVRLSLRSCGEAARPRVSAPAGGVDRVCVARRRVGGRKAGAPIGSARSGSVCRRSSGNGRRGRRPMLGWHIGVIGPCCAVSGYGSWWVRVGRVRSRRLSVRSWSVSVRIGARLTRVVIRHCARLTTSGV
jgi:hypothetical protein